MFENIDIVSLIDIGVITFLIYIVLVWFKRTRAAFVLTGILIVSLVYLLAQQFNLFLTTWVLRGFYAVILVALVIIFQEEIRRFFEQVALWSTSPHLRGRMEKRLRGYESEALVRTLNDLSREKIGALIVIRGKNLIFGYLTGGMELGGRLSEPLLKSIFDPHSPGHDGAVIISGDRISRFGTHLPLSKNLAKLEFGGTRHAAALGLSEISDALCIVVSEETGRVSVAHHGDIRHVGDPAEMLRVIEKFYRGISPAKEKGSWFGIIFKNWKEKTIALVLAVLLWFVQVYGSQIIYKTVTIPVNYAEAPSQFQIVDVKPKKVDITFSGQRKNLYFLRDKHVQIYLKTLNLREGTQNLKITGSELAFPSNIKLENISPTRVSIEAKKTGETE